MEFRKKILCIGAGYVGGPTMGVIALKCPEYKVSVVDINEEKIRRWNSSQLPIYEPGLDKIIEKTRGKNLFFSTDIQKEINDAAIIFVSVNTPTKTFGDGAGMAPDLQYWEKTARLIVDNSNTSKIIIEKSTLPVKTAQAMERILKSTGNRAHFEVVSNPEFLAEGTAVRDLLEPDRVLIGSHQNDTGLRAANEIVEIYLHWVKREKIITTNVWSSELSKLISNAFLAQRISSINSVSALCEKTGAVVSEIARAVGADTRIGSKFLNAGVGFGGSCFRKDILNLVYIARSYGLDEVGEYWEGVLKINEYQQNRFVMGILNAMFNTLVDKRIALFGFAFKANTGDTRDSPAIHIAKKLWREKAFLAITDPKAIENAKMELSGMDERITYEADPYAAARCASAIIVTTDWELFKDLDYRRIFNSMEKPSFIFDGRNILDHPKLFEIGFNVYPIGTPPLTHF